MENSNQLDYLSRLICDNKNHLQLTENTISTFSNLYVNGNSV